MVKISDDIFKSSIITWPTLCVLLLTILLLHFGCGPRESGKGGAGGRVVDQNGNVLENVLVFSKTEEQFSHTNDKGLFYLTSLSTGLHTIVARKKYFTEDSLQVDIKMDGFVNNLVFQLSPTSNSAEIFNVQIKNIGENAAQIHYQANSAALGQVEYGESVKFDMLSEKTPAFLAIQKIDLSSLKPDTQYFFRIKIVDEDGKERSSSIYNFKTLRSSLPQTPVNFRFEQPGSFNSLKLAWNKVDFKGFKAFQISRREEDQINFQPLSDEITTEEYHDLDLTAGKRYEYRLVALSQDRQSSPTTIIKSLVCGTIRQIVTWDEKHSPYIIQGDMHVEAGAIFNIQEGTEVLIATDTLRSGGEEPEKVLFTIDGTMRVTGTAQKPVILRSLPQPGKNALRGSWMGMKFNGYGPGKSSLEYVEISDFNKQAIFADGTTVEINNAILSNGIHGIILKNSVSKAAINGRLNSIQFKDLTGTAVIFDSLFYNEILSCDFDGQFSPLLGINLNTLIMKNNLIRTPGRSASMTVDTFICENNIFEIQNTLGIAVNGSDIILRKNTINARSGITLYNQKRFKIEDNIFVSLEQVGDVGVAFTRTEVVATPTTPLLIYNDIHNFNSRHIGCQEGDGQADLLPDFIGGEPFDYDLRPFSPLRLMGKNRDRVGATPE
ncbi:hypothetical protein ACFL35_05220 [Candidatus Riflebacteria bacterium]